MDLNLTQTQSHLAGCFKDKKGQEGKQVILGCNIHCYFYFYFYFFMPKKRISLLLHMYREMRILHRTFSYNGRGVFSQN